ncbi:hypothetical protein [Epilithonimonas sp.]
MLEIKKTFSLETSMKIFPFVSVSPFYSYYSQTSAKYFTPYQQAHGVR